jgi:hypothetical protein
MLSGWKTYIIMAIGVIANGCYAMGIIPVEYMGVVNAILAFLGLGALRAGIASK